MKIGIDIRSLMTKNRSGVGEYTYNTLDNILRADRRNQYFLFYNSWKDVATNLPNWQYQNVKFIKHSWPNKIFNLLQFLGILKLDRLCGGVDVFWLPNWHFASFSDRVKLVITVHDLSHLKYPEFLSFKRRAWHKFLKLKSLLGRADKIISVSQNTKNDLIEMFKIKSNKIKPIYSGVSKAQDISPDEIMGVKQKYKLEKDYILFLGTIEPRKNILGIIQAFDDFCHKNSELDLDLVLAGEFGWQTRAIKTRIENSKFRSRIKILGYVSQSEKNVLYSQAKTLVYPSFYEGFGLPPLEAMDYGCPVITSLNSSLPEVVGSAGLLVDPLSTRDMVLAIEAVLKNQGLREGLVGAGYEQVKKFNWLKTAEETLGELVS